MISNVYPLSNLQQTITAHPERWRPIVFTNGCFDLIHVGHVRYLQFAKSLGRSLVVGLNSDRSVQMIKPKAPGTPLRPIIPEAQRAEVIAALKPVDGVIIFDDITANTLIRTLQPEIYVKGGDYNLETLPEASEVLAYGGQIEFARIEIPSSTTRIIQHILNSTSVA